MARIVKRKEGVAFSADTYLHIQRDCFGEVATPFYASSSHIPETHRLVSTRQWGFMDAVQMAHRLCAPFVLNPWHLFLALGIRAAPIDGVCDLTSGKENDIHLANFLSAQDGQIPACPTTTILMHMQSEKEYHDPCLLNPPVCALGIPEFHIEGTLQEWDYLISQVPHAKLAQSTDDTHNFITTAIIYIAFADTRHDFWYDKQGKVGISGFLEYLCYYDSARRLKLDAVFAHDNPQERITLVGGFGGVLQHCDTRAISPLPMFVIDRPGQNYEITPAQSVYSGDNDDE